MRKSVGRKDRIRCTTAIISSQMLQSKRLNTISQIPRKDFSRCVAIAAVQPLPRPRLNSASIHLFPTQTSPTIQKPTRTFLQFTNIASRTEQILRHFSSSSASSSDKMSYGKPASEFTVRRVGAPNTLDFRAFVEKDGTPISPFHDVPLYANEQQTVLNMIVEIPRWTNAKLEVCRSTEG